MPHFSQTPFTVPVFDLMHRPGEMRIKELDIVVPEDLGTTLIAVKAGDTLHVDLRMEALHDGILVSVSVDGEAIGECGRCLIEMRQPVEVEFQELFAYSQDEAFEYEVQEDSIDLEPVLRDAVVLSLPFQPVCQEDCLGLCPQCGARLLDNPGHEHEAPIDPRWASLVGLEGLAGASTHDVDGVDNNDATEEKR